MRNCVTHHICDCLSEKMECLEKRLAALERVHKAAEQCVAVKWDRDEDYDELNAALEAAKEAP